MSLTDEDVREILRIIDDSELDELHIETEGFSLHVRKGSNAAGPAPAPAEAAVLPARAPADSVSPAPAPATAPATADATPPGHRGDEAEDGLVTIDSPMLGTFYRAEGPGAAPFVESGSPVEPDTIVCIIEVMKMMNSVAAGVAGKVVEVCPENAALVEYGQPLFRVQPA